MQQNEGPSLEEFVDCEELTEQDHGGPSFQQDPVDDNNDDTSQDNEGPATLQYLHAKDDAQNQSQESAFGSVAEPSTSFATSFTSSFNTHLTCSRR